MVDGPDTVLYAAAVTVTGGREGRASSCDGFIDFDLRLPKEMGGPGGATNPEQLFAAGYAACFQGALGVAGRNAGVDTSKSTVTCDVELGTIGAEYRLTATLNVAIPGVTLKTAQDLADAAHEVCPYSNATRGNIPVKVIAAAVSSALTS